MRFALGLSAAVHALALLVLIFGLPRWYKNDLPKPPVVIPIEIAEIADITNAKVRDEKPQPPKPVEQPKPEPAKPQPAPPKPPEPKPEPPKPSNEPKVDELAELLKRVKDKKEKPKEEKPPEQDLTSVLKNVAKLKETTPQKPDEKPAKNPAPTPPSAPTLADRLTITEEDLLRRQISQCWNVPAGARYAEQLIVEVVIDVNPDRTVMRAEVVDQARLSDPFFRAAAESAMRALRHPRCTPLELPPEKYESWKRIYFTFDPRDVL
ncbi:MAG: hypothetical protein EBQ89_11090 [Alphaproteobacteria bacterium]|nr:hypothetical protein [Alphaproteobacteria bacterium]